MTRIFFGVLAMATVVVASNILVQFLILDGILTWGAFTYPIAFLVTDIMNRVYGAQAARKVILAGFVVGIICSLIGNQIQLEFGPAVPLRIAIASATAFLVAQLLDVAIFNRLRNGSWWKAPIISTVVSSTVDAVLFFTIAFAAFINFGETANAEISWAWDAMPLMTVGAEMPFWVTLGVADYAVKLAIALLALVPFRVIVGQMLAKKSAA